MSKRKRTGSLGILSASPDHCQHQSRKRRELPSLRCQFILESLWPRERHFNRFIHPSEEPR